MSAQQLQLVKQPGTILAQSLQEPILPARPQHNQ